MPFNVNYRLTRHGRGCPIRLYKRGNNHGAPASSVFIHRTKLRSLQGSGVRHGHFNRFGGIGGNGLGDDIAAAIRKNYAQIALGELDRRLDAKKDSKQYGDQIASRMAELGGNGVGGHFNRFGGIGGNGIRKKSGTRQMASMIRGILRL